MSEFNFLCRCCGNADISLVRTSCITNLKIENFSISDLNYGVTLSLYKCNLCNLIQAPVDDVSNFYENLIDPDYEEGRYERKLQSNKIISFINTLLKNSSSQHSLLDIGAGSGIMVESACNFGFKAEGIEPSKWLSSIALKRNLNVYTGVLPHKNITKKYDVITIIDVIEHVTNPSLLLMEAKKILNADGMLVIVTPNVSSLAAKILGYRWWHYRIAHITYFNKDNLTTLLVKNGFKVIRYKYPAWYFSYPYLYERLIKYIPKFFLPKSTGKLNNLVIKVNPFDSIMAICINDLD